MSNKIYYLVTRPFGWTISRYFETYGQALQKHLRVIPYEGLLGVKRFGSGVYIFSDVERLTGVTTDLALQLWERLDKAGNGVVVLNHPLRSMRRFQLLRHLHDSGINDFNVYWLRDGVIPKRFPVFIRDESKHAYFYSSILRTPEELAAATAKIRPDRGRFNRSLIVEFCDTSDTGGIFRKYSSFIIGDRVLPWYVYFSRNWDVRLVHHVQEWTESMDHEEEQYVRHNPYASVMRDVFRTAGIQYGRLDFSLLNGRPQVWEINTNPDIFAAKTFPSQRLARRDFLGGELTSIFQGLLAKAEGKTNLVIFFGIRRAVYWREIFDSALRMAWDFLKGLFPRQARLAVRDCLTRIPVFKRFRRHE